MAVFEIVDVLTRTVRYRGEEEEELFYEVKFVYWRHFGNRVWHKGINRGPSIVDEWGIMYSTDEVEFYSIEDTSTIFPPPDTWPENVSHIAISYVNSESGKHLLESVRSFTPEDIQRLRGEVR